jgi:hypothetical protein
MLPASAPGRAITREAAESRPPEPVTSPADSLDYGREIELPDEIPPSSPRETVTVAAAAAPVAPPEPVAARTAPEPVRRPAPQAVAQAAPQAAQQPIAHAEPVTDRKPVVAAQPAPAPVVIPVKLPPNGAHGEIVIRIVFERQD